MPGTLFRSLLLSVVDGLAELHVVYFSGVLAVIRNQFPEGLVLRHNVKFLQDSGELIKANT